MHKIIWIQIAINLLITTKKNNKKIKTNLVKIKIKKTSKNKEKKMDNLEKIKLKTGIKFLSDKDLNYFKSMK